MDYRFEYADKAMADTLLVQLFRILYDNMNLIDPTNNSYEQDYKCWFSAVYPALQKRVQRQIVLMYCGECLCGFFQYTVNSSTLVMEEIQIIKAYQGKGLFSAFFFWLIQVLPRGIETVEAYASKKNSRSQSILAHLGLKQIGETENGNCYHYKGDYTSLSEKYS